MGLGFLTENFSISLRKFLALLFLFSGNLAWFMAFYNRFDEIFDQFFPENLVNVGNGIFLICIIVSAITVSVISEKLNRKKLLFLLTFLGVISTFPIVFFGDSFSFILTVLLAGISFGSSYPVILAYLTDSTIPEERCRISGFMALSVFIIVFFTTLILEIFRPNAYGVILITTILKMTGFFPLVLDSIDRKSGIKIKWKKILSHRNFSFFLLAYILFNICSGLVTVVWQARPEGTEWEVANANANVIRYLGIAFVAVVTGFVADKIGRKRPVIVGLVLLGISYALVGLDFNPDTFFYQHVFSGLAWGILIVLYTSIPGDFAFQGSTEKFYAFGVIIPFILYTAINGGWRFLNYEPDLPLFSTILSMALFLSIIPILYASEPLSESKIKEIKFRDYTRKVSRIVKETEEKE